MKKSLFISIACAAFSALLLSDVWANNDRLAIRLYTDYFCGPCQIIEAETSELLAQISKKGLGVVQYIDTPSHKETVLYARYFIYATQGRDKAAERMVRKALYRAAREKIRDDKSLSCFLRDQGIALTQCSVEPFFKRYSSHIRADGVTSTPTCVIEGRDGKKILKGIKEITTELKYIANN